MMLDWRVLEDSPLPGPRNMARDHALARELREGTGVFRLYRWDPPTISFGRNEPAWGRYDLTKASEEGIAFVRRPTGGRAVLHHRELTYALVFPVRAFGGLKAAYRLINKGLLAGIRSLGAAAELAHPSGPSLPPDAGPCFRQPAEGEVTARGRKLIGSAQVRLGGAVLQHGSIILDGDQSILRELRGDDEPVPPPATLRRLMGFVPEVEALARCLQDGLALTLGGTWTSGTWSKAEGLASEELEAHYSDEDWTWRI